MEDKPKDKRERDEEDLVVTPGGPRPRRLVKQVGPGEAVRFDKEGEAEIVRRDDEVSPETEERTENDN
jgi:hypothetical protein